MRRISNDTIRFKSNMVLKLAVTALVCTTALGCMSRPSEAAQASGRPQRSRATRPATPDLPPVMAAEGKIAITLDTPPELREPNASAKGASFQIGFFDRDELIGTVVVAPEPASVSGATVRLDVPLIPLPKGARNPVGVRVRLLTTGALGAWSATAGSVTLPDAGGPAGTSARRAQSGQQARNRAERPAGRRAQDKGARAGLTAAELDAHPALKSAIAPLLGSSLSLADAAGAFDRVQDLAVAVVVSREHEVPFADLCKAMIESQRKSLANAIRSVKPSVDAERAVRRARNEARGLVTPRQRR
jgi:hypothetical protein